MTTQAIRTHLRVGAETIVTVEGHQFSVELTVAAGLGVATAWLTKTDALALARTLTEAAA